MGTSGLGAAVGALLVALTACGTTVSVEQQGARSGSQSGDGTVAGAPGAGPLDASSPAVEGASGDVVAGQAAQAGAAAGVSSGLSDAGAVGASRPGSSGSTGASTASGPGAVRATQGVTATTVTIGVVVLKNGDKYANSFGFAISYGDAEREFKALVDDVNARGGVAGRRVTTVIAYYDVGGAAIDKEALQASLCSQFTQDHKVFAVLMPYNPLQSFVDCLAKHKTLLLNGSAASTDDLRLRQVAGWLYQPSIPSYSGYPRQLVRALSAHGFFTGPTPKAGILVLDLPDMVRAAERDMKPAIEAAGVKVAEVTRISTSTSANSDISGAVLKYRSEGITHVFFVQAAGGLPLYFMQGAEQQQYFPRYGLSTFEAPGYFLEGNVPASQLRNARGIGWAPFFDVKPTQLATRPAERRCFDIISRAGETNANRGSNLSATPVCDLVWVFAAAAAAAGNQLDVSTWRRGLVSLGKGYESPVALSSDFSRGRPYANSGYRSLAFNTECSCFRYDGALKTDLGG
jgi:ABC-type branched-subunit amino acid transport system substrate-binding protein